MPIVKCPDCSKDVSDSAPACPHCGRPMKENISAKDETNKEVKKEGGSFLLFLGILFLPIIFAWFTLRDKHSRGDRILAFGWLALYMISLLGSGDRPSSSKVASSRPQVSSESAVLLVDISDILAAYKSNEVGADNYYKDKLAQVTGVIGVIKKDIVDNLYVTLGTGADFEIPVFQAFFDDSMNDQLGQLRQGDTLTVTCRIYGLMGNVLAKDCVINSS